MRLHNRKQIIKSNETMNSEPFRSVREVHVYRFLFYTATYRAKMTRCRESLRELMLWAVCWSVATDVGRPLTPLTDVHPQSAATLRSPSVPPPCPFLFVCMSVFVILSASDTLWAKRSDGPRCPEISKIPRFYGGMTVLFIIISPIGSIN